MLQRFVWEWLMQSSVLQLLLLQLLLRRLLPLEEGNLVSSRCATL